MKFSKPSNYYTIFEPRSGNFESSVQYFALILYPDANQFRRQLKDYLSNNHILARLYFDDDLIIFNNKNPINLPHD